MPSCCLTKHTCLAERARAMRLNGPYGWSIPCMDCIEGCARQMDRWKPELDIEPKVIRDPATILAHISNEKCVKGHTDWGLRTNRRIPGGEPQKYCKACHRNQRERWRRKMKEATP